MKFIWNNKENVLQAYPKIDNEKEVILLEEKDSHSLAKRFNDCFEFFKVYWTTRLSFV